MLKMNNNYDTKKRKTISISEEAYHRFTKNGIFGENMTDVLMRVLDQAEAYKKIKLK